MRLGTFNKSFHIGWAASEFLTRIKILTRRRQSHHDAQWRASNYQSRQITNFWGGRQFFVAPSPMWKPSFILQLLPIVVWCWGHFRSLVSTSRFKFSAIKNFEYFWEYSAWDSNETAFTVLSEPISVWSTSGQCLRQQTSLSLLFSWMDSSNKWPVRASKWTKFCHTLTCWPFDLLTCWPVDLLPLRRICGFHVKGLLAFCS